MVKKSSQKIFNNSLLYSLGTIASKAVGFFLVPIYTYNMTSTDYGIGTTIASFVSTFGIVIMLSLRAAMMRFYNEYDNTQKQRFVGSIVSFVLLNALIVCTLLCVFNELYVGLLFENLEFFPCVFLGVLSLGAEGIYLTYQSLLQARQDGKNYSKNSIVYLFFHAITVVIFIAVFKMGVLGFVLSTFITNFCFAVYGIISMRLHGYMVFCWEKPILKKSILYSLPILPHNLATNLNAYSVKIIINKFISYAVSGIYSLAMQFSTIMSLVQSSINLAFRPWFIEQMQQGEEGRKEIKHMTCMIMTIYAFCAVGISLFCKELIVIMSEETYWDAWIMVSFFVVTQLISFIYYSHVQTLMYNLKMSKITAICSISGLIVNVVVALLLVEVIGIYGVLVSQIVSQIVMATITVVLSNKAEHVDFGLWKMIVTIIIAIALMGCGMFVSMNGARGFDVVGILIKFVLLVVAFCVFILPYGKELLDLIKGIFNRKRGKENV